MSVQRRASFGSGIGPSSIPASPKLSEQGSPDVNKDIKSLLYSAQKQQDTTQKSPGDKQHISSSKRLNPFDSAKPSPERSIAEILKTLKRELGGDLQMFGRGATTVKTSKFYTVCNDKNVKVSLDDVKRLVKHLDDLRDTDEASFLDKDDDAIDIVQLRALLNPAVAQRQAPEAASSSELRRLMEDNKRLREMLEDDNGFNDIKVQKLRSEIADSEMDKRVLKQKVEKLEAQKSRLEDIFKATMKGGTMELIDQVQLMVRRIEFLEE